MIAQLISNLLQKQGFSLAIIYSEALSVALVKSLFQNVFKNLGKSDLNKALLFVLITIPPFVSVLFISSHRRSHQW